MEEPAVPRSDPSAKSDAIPNEIENYIVELECQIRILHSELDALRPLSKLALVDSMTGLSNRRYFDMRIEAEQKRVKADPDYVVSVLILDLDNLKVINDSFGHGAGDRALRGAAEAVKRVLRPDDVCCRIGGDELAVIASSCGRHARAMLASRLQTVIARVEGPWPEGLLRVSIGGTTSTEDGADVIRLVALADQRMYEDKWKYKRSSSWQQFFRAPAGPEAALTRVFISGWTWVTQAMGVRREMWMNRATTSGRGSREGVNVSHCENGRCLGKI